MKLSVSSSLVSFVSILLGLERAGKNLNILFYMAMVSNKIQINSTSIVILNKPNIRLQCIEYFMWYKVRDLIHRYISNAF